MCLLAVLPGYAQFNCPAPWSTSQNVFGIVTLDGSASGTSGDFKESVSQHAIFAGELYSSFPLLCQWQAIPNSGVGVMKSEGTENDQLTYTPNGNFSIWSAAGTGDPLWDDLSLTINPAPLSGVYVVGAFAAIPGQLLTNSGPTSEDIILGGQSTACGVSEPNQVLPPSPTFLYGTASYQTPACNNGQGGGLINANWTATWAFSPIPDGTCKDCQDKRGSAVSIRNQSLGEDIPIVGTEFLLHYESNRSAGRAGADPIAIRDAMSLGGWTLNVHHALEPLLMIYCAGGSCTPYSTMPKALFLGDGTMRNSSEVQTPLVVGSNLQLTSEDGSEIYVFDASTWKHTQTLLPMTGAVLYSFGYDSNNLLITVTDDSGNVTTIQRDANGHPTAIVSPYGQTTKIATDANGYLSQVSDPMGHSIKLTNTSSGLLKSYKDANGNLFTFQYDANGFLTKDSDPAGGVLNLALANNASGFTVTETTAQNRTNSSKVAFSNTSTSTTQTFTNTWTNGLQASETDSQQSGQLTEGGSLPSGQSYSKTYGPDPRWGIQLPIATSESLTRGNLTMNVSGSRAANFTAGNPFSLVSQTDSQTINSRAYSSVFTSSNLTYVNTSPAGRVRTIVLDAQERPSTAQLTGMALNKFTYDSHGRLASFSEGTRKYTFAYAASGFLASVTDPLLQKTSFTYDSAGRPLSATLPDGRVLHDTVDANGNLTSITAPNGSKHSFTYSAVNLPVSYVPPAVTGTGPKSFTVNADRDATQITRADGNVISYAYDSAGRLITLTAPTETVNFAYSGTTGNLSSASVSGGEAITYGYNGSLRISSQWTGTVAGTVSSSFDNNFWVASQAVAGSANVAYTHDNDGFVTKVGSLTIKRSATTGLVTGSTLGSTTDTRAANTFAELTSYTGKFQTTALYTAAYTRDKLGRVVTNTETIGGTTNVYGYTYDKAGRLTGVTTNGTTTSTYSYDTNSNRTAATTSQGSVAATYDAQDRLLTYGNASYAYSADGELTSKTAGTQVTAYQYDVLGNLIAVTLPNGKQISYIIDAENNRVGKEVNGVLTTGFLYDGADLVAQLNASNKVVSRFVYSGVSNTPDYMISGGVTYRIFSDHLGSPRLVVNSSTGAIAERIDYDEFGNVINDSNPGFQPFGFEGGLYDQDTKLLRFDTRDYDASTGRWTAKDPILFSGGDTNLYAYVGNDPVNRTDPTGYDASDVGMGVLDAYFIAIGQPQNVLLRKAICDAVMPKDTLANKALKDAQKNFGAMKEREALDKEVVKSKPAVEKQGNTDRGVLNQFNGAFNNQGGPQKPCPCKEQPAPSVPDTQPISRDQGSARQRQNEKNNLW